MLPAAANPDLEEDQGGRRHDQMPADRARHPHGHESGPRAVPMQYGVLCARLLLDLPGQSSMVCEGRLGSRAGRASSHTVLRPTWPQARGTVEAAS